MYLKAYHGETQKEKMKEVDIAVLESNDPCEDRFSVRISADIQAFTVIDGHGGYLAADIAVQHLLDEILLEINSLCGGRSPKAIVRAIENAFFRIDKLILEEATKMQHCTISSPGKKSARTNTLPKASKAPGRAGCCAVVTLLTDGLIFVGHVGDCKAVVFKEESESSSSDEETEDLQSLGDLGGDDNAPCDKQPASSAVANVFSSTTTSDIVHDASPSPSAVSMETVDNYLIGVENLRQANPRLVLRNKRVHELTTDHCCSNPVETQAITSKSLDPDPIRHSAGDLALFGSSAARRVAGSLAVTRALGDGYLKVPELSTSPFQQYVPYITCHPTVSYRKLLPTDRHLLLASDGLWNYLSPLQCQEILSSLNSGDEKPSFQTADGIPLPLFSLNSHVAAAATEDSSNNKNSSSSTHNTSSPSWTGFDWNLCHLIAKGSHKYHCNWPSTNSRKETPKERSTTPTRKKQRPNEHKSDALVVENCNISTTEEGVSAGMALLEHCIETAAKSVSITSKKLLAGKLPRGLRKRDIIDDVTIMVITL